MKTEETWTPLTEPYESSGGQRVENVGSIDKMVSIGRHFRNALERRELAAM